MSDDLHFFDLPPDLLELLLGQLDIQRPHVLVVVLLLLRSRDRNDELVLRQ